MKEKERLPQEVARIGPRRAGHSQEANPVSEESGRTGRL